MGLTNLANLDEFVAVNRRNHQAYADGLRDVEGMRLMGTRPARDEQLPVRRGKVDAARGRARSCADGPARATTSWRGDFWPGSTECSHMRPSDGPRPHLPRTEWVADRVLVLPGGPTVVRDDVELVAATIGEVLLT